MSKTIEEMLDEAQKAIVGEEGVSEEEGTEGEPANKATEGSADEMTKALAMEGDSELVKAIGGMTKNVEGILTALVGDETEGKKGLIDRVVDMESGKKPAVVSKSVQGQDADNDFDDPDAGKWQPVGKAKGKDEDWGPAVKGLLTHGRITLKS